MIARLRIAQGIGGITLLLGMVGALGVSNASRVVFYDQHGLRGSPRGWWMMRLVGHD